MTFEEFFKKKRINLAAFEKSEPALYLEFKSHYREMGEKSFDHTKKYWFNKLRREYLLPLEVRTEKPKIENPLAEQTITESLAETSSPAQPAPKTAFIPRFKASIVAKPPETGEAKNQTETQPQEANNSPEPAPLKPGYQPRFKMKPKTGEAENSIDGGNTPEQEEPTPAKPAYKPRSNIKNIPPESSEE